MDDSFEVTYNGTITSDDYTGQTVCSGTTYTGPEEDNNVVLEWYGRCKVGSVNIDVTVESDNSAHGCNYIYTGTITADDEGNSIDISNNCSITVVP